MTEINLSCSTDAIFILRHLQEKYLNKVPWKILWWALCLAGVPEWLVKVVQAMYQYQYQGPVLSPLLFIIVLEALSRKFCVGHLWKVLYAKDLVILAEMFEDLMTKMAVSKNGLESKGLKININKTKVMTSGRNLHTLQTFGKYPCAICRRGVRINSIFCSGCSFWVQKKCSDIPSRLVQDSDFRCRRGIGNWWKTLCWSPTCFW